MLMVARRENALGFSIVDLTREQDAAILFPDVIVALETIREHDPRRFRRICRDVKCIGIIHSRRSAGEYWRELGAIVVSSEHLRAQTVPAVCMTMIHEATHARLENWGVRRRQDERVERACVKEEIRFVRRIPGTDRLVEGARLKLETRWWDSSQPRREFSERLRRLNAPKWVRRLLLWINS